ncbi:hypothetical protein [Thermococcus sp. JCM 11816]|uniref:hypothetical protein n=1 Tax=Thermococcus sp. (strain JCM 11816 / KS-1) TaxID=1295125 RepID=UPI0034679702
MLFGTLAVGTGTVSATGGDIRDLKFDVVFYFTSNTLSFDVVQSKISGTLVGNVFTFSKSYDNVEYVHKLIDLGNGEWKLVICNMTLDPIMVFTSDNTHFFAPNNFPDEGAFEKIPYQRAFDSFVSQLDISAELKNMYLLTNDSRIPGGELSESCGRTDIHMTIMTLLRFQSVRML